MPNATPISNNPFAALVSASVQETGDTWRWGRVVGTHPLQVQLDGDTTPLNAHIDSLANLTLGDRVHVHIYNRRAVIVGVSGGQQPPSYARIDLTPTHGAAPTAYLLTDGVRCTLTMGHWNSSTKQPIKAYQTINAWQLPKKYAPANDVATHISYGLGIVNVTASGVIELYAAKDIAKNNTLAINLTWIAGL